MRAGIFQPLEMVNIILLLLHLLKMKVHMSGLFYQEEPGEHYILAHVTVVPLNSNHFARFTGRHFVCIDNEIINFCWSKCFCESLPAQKQHHMNLNVLVVMGPHSLYFSAESQQIKVWGQQALNDTKNIITIQTEGEQQDLCQTLWSCH